MASEQNTLTSPLSPPAALALAVSNFLATGASQPTLATPTFRTGSGAQQFSSGTTMHVPISASVQAGDLILCVIATNNTSGTPAVPTGFSFAGLAGTTSFAYVYYKFATVSDPGTTVTYTTTSGSRMVSTVSYQNVNRAVPFAGSAASSSSATATTYTAPQVTVPASSLVVAAFSAYGNSGTNSLTTGDNQRITAATGVYANAVADATYGPGTTGPTGLTSGIASYFGAVVLVLNGAVSGGTAPPGGWTLVESYSPTSLDFPQTTGFTTNNPAMLFMVWQANLPGSSSHWYLTIGYSLAGNIFLAWAHEMYTLSGHLWNAPSASITGTMTDTPTVGSGGSPPFALIYPTPQNVGNLYRYMHGPGTTSMATGTFEYQIIANADGLLLSVLNGTALQLAFFVGLGTTLVANPDLSDPVPLFTVDFIGFTAGTTREPGWTTAGVPWGRYGPQVYAPLPSFLAGTINDDNSNNDFFQSPNTSTLTARWLLCRVTGTPSTAGYVRALLPAWIQYANQSGCAWADTATEGSDTLTYLGDASHALNLWVDTSA